jgi:hypothetical protein
LVRQSIKPFNIERPESSILEYMDGRWRRVDRGRYYACPLHVRVRRGVQLDEGVVALGEPLSVVALGEENVGLDDDRLRKVGVGTIDRREEGNGTVDVAVLHRKLGACDHNAHLLWCASERLDRLLNDSPIAGTEGAWGRKRKRERG